MEWSPWSRPGVALEPPWSPIALEIGFQGGVTISLRRPASPYHPFPAHRAQPPPTYSARHPATPPSHPDSSVPILPCVLRRPARPLVTPPSSSHRAQSPRSS